MDNLYILVDTENKVLLNFIQELPENWNNICGLNRIDKSQLGNLAWAGHPSHGWLPINDKKIKSCTFSEDWIEGCKGSLKRVVSQKRWEKENENVFVTVNNNSRMLKISERLKTSLLLIKVSAEADNTFTTDFKFSDGEYETLNASQIIEIYSKVTNYITACFAAEKSFSQSVSNCTTVANLVSLDYNINWPSTTL